MRSPPTRYSQHPQPRTYEEFLAQSLSVLERVGDAFSGADERLDYLNKTMLRVEALLAGRPIAPVAPLAPLVSPLPVGTPVEAPAAPVGIAQVSVVGLVRTLALDALYTAIILDDEEAYVQVIREETVEPATDGWNSTVTEITAAGATARICIQRQFYIWGSPTIQFAWGVDTQDKQVGPFTVPPAPALMDFTRWWEKRRLHVYRKNTSSSGYGEYHAVFASIRPRVEDWGRRWKPKLLGLSQALKEETVVVPREA